MLELDALGGNYDRKRLSTFLYNSRLYSAASAACAA